MKILQIINNLGSGGAEKLLEEMIPIMNRVENIEVDLLILTDIDNVFYDSLISQGVKINIVKYRNIYDPRNIIEIRSHIINGKYDVVHSHIFPTQYWVSMAKLLLINRNIKFITTEHSTYNRRRNKIYLRWLEKFIYRQYDSIISITEKTKENLAKWIDPKNEWVEKHVVIENGVDLDKIKNAIVYKKCELISSLSEEDKLICMVGRFTEAKDQPTLLRAINRLPHDVHLVLLGEGPLLQSNIKLVNELGISDRVHFLGFRQDIPRILKTVDIIILSSYWEGLSLSSIEGMASGKPFIASKVNGLEEIVRNAGLLFNQGDDKELADIIVKLLDDNSFYREISSSCLAKSEKYSIVRTVGNLIEEYKRFLK